MSDPEVTGLALRWLQYARDDLRIAELIREARDAPPRIACFHAQQAAEKAIKALLIAHQTRFPHVHDLVELAGLLPEAGGVGASERDLEDLSLWAIEPRYPGDVLEATADDAARL